MITTCIHFQYDQDNNNLTILSAHLSPNASEFKTAIDQTNSWQTALASRVTMEEAIRRKLTAGGLYPKNEGYSMRNALGWENGLKIIIPQNFDDARHIKFNLNYKTCWLIPELLPIREEGDEVIWLDKIGPICRTLEHIEQPPVNRPERNKLAIIHQDLQPFTEMAESLQRKLLDKLNGSLLIDRYSGQQLAGDSSRRYSVLHDIFTKYICVIFVGHMGKSRQHDFHDKHGWMMTENPKDVLTMDELNVFLGGKRPGGRHLIPELIFACCCHSASSDPTQDNQPALSYPKLFLDAGVRFYIGTWMDIISRSRETAVILLEDFITNFFEFWVKEPGNAVEHLYIAKKFCGFPLITSLFQIYSASGEQAVSGSREPYGALVSGLASKDRIGEYELTEQAWADRYARTFWAKDSNGSKHLVQILADEFQNDDRLGEKLNIIIEKLKGAQLGKGHLIPTKYDRLMPTRGQDKQYPLHVLVYDRDDFDSQQDWSTLSQHPFEPGRFTKVLQIGERISNLLAELHHKDIIHGNLDPGNIVFNNGEVLIKDTWVRHIRPGRCTQQRYAAPEEPQGGQLSDQLKYDCWGLGVILFELATGQPPFKDPDDATLRTPRSIHDIITTVNAPVLDALDRVIRECLVPSAKLRPSAEQVAIRLQLAQYTDGTYLSEFEEQLNCYIQAGHHLFGIIGDDYDELLKALSSLANRTRQNVMSQNNVEYHLYTMEENKGLTDDNNQTRVPWTNSQELYAMMVIMAQNNNQPLPFFPTPPEVANFNASKFLHEFSSLYANEKIVPIILIRGNHWWNYGPEAHRYIRMCQSHKGSGPVVVITDNVISLEPELDHLFIKMAFPYPSPPALFEDILGFAKKDGLNVSEELSVDEAVLLASRFYPCYWRQVRQALRLCMLRYGKVDERALIIRDEQRDQEFSSIRGVKYVPVSQLPPPEHIGLPKALRQQIDTWAETINVSIFAPLPFLVPRRIMITGPFGCGKTTLALTISSLTNRPLLSIDASQCIRERLGESEQALRIALNAANRLDAGVVLLDDVDRFFKNQSNDANRVSDSSTATMARMSGTVLNWIDNLPTNIVVIMTAERFRELPDQWQRRCELILPLPQPMGGSDKSIEYRQNIFKAIFEKFGLNSIAGDTELISTLASKTDPDLGIKRLMSPIARKARNSSLRNHTVLLQNGTDIQNWIQETILLHGLDENPKDCDFWEKTLQVEKTKESMKN